jgi:hypothetical protein
LLLLAIPSNAIPTIIPVIMDSHGNPGIAGSVSGVVILDELVSADVTSDVRVLNAVVVLTEVAIVVAVVSAVVETSLVTIELEVTDEVATELLV